MDIYNDNELDLQDTECIRATMTRVPPTFGINPPSMSLSARNSTVYRLGHRGMQPLSAGYSDPAAV